MNLLSSTPPEYDKERHHFQKFSKTLPSVNSPLELLSVVLGSKEIPNTLASIRPRVLKLSTTVGIEVSLSGDKVPVDSEG